MDSHSSGFRGEERGGRRYHSEEKRLYPLFTDASHPIELSLEEAIKMRYKDIMEDFERNQAEAHNEAGIETALTRLKDDLEKLKDAVYIPALPESIRLKFPEAVDQAADAAQHALEESARRDHSGIMAHLLQNHRINDLQEAK